MSYNISLSDRFQKDAKRLSKRYASFKTDLIKLIEDLEENPMQGDNLGKSCYKIRLKIESKKKGKSGGARVITYVHISQEDVYLLTVYDKSDRESLENGELEELLEAIEA
ncbi:mRNA-degrading endonuclease RelE of RelBE toxin-antitoxin system [Arcicella aurantiaca]|uniref:mRNA-degrading endonuclease RelE of RelBE toxin-antitoxin system n=1 Tax=Arcicella aurantiaca TaxID=591202 RepID=A0A316DY01_9BACT|nr:type II toxin-antitoxin system RelE/ParE family toxin [Arcicella aurantiaca]PWK22981.1 mRNA-degrading endonuclease RelE of RelBE toxin-antitoxin system [Arcicella aurantiaca]